jgi:O-antigen/teichoic acid export membrane protein
MLRGLLRDTVSYGLVNFLNRLLVFLLFPVYARFLAPGELGALDLVSSIGAVLVLLLSMEIVLAHGRFAADTPKGGVERATVAATAWMGVMLTLVPAVALMVIHRDTLLIAAGLGQAAPTLAAPALVLWVGLVLQHMVQNHLRWESRKAQFAAVSLVQGVVTVSLGLWLVAGLKQGAHGALVATASGVSASVALGLYFLREDIHARPDLRLWRRMIAFCAPLAAGGMLLVAAQHTDRFLLARMAGLEELAEYGIALRFGLVASLAVGSAQMAIGPMVYDHHSSTRLGATLSQVAAFYALLGAGMVCGFSLLAPELVRLLATSRYAESASLVGMTTLSALLYGAAMLFPGLLLSRRTRLLGACHAFYAVMLVGLSILGLKYGGVHGLALGVLVANFTFIFLLARLSRRVLPMGIDRTSGWVASAAVTVGLAAAAWPPHLALRVVLLVAVLGALAVTAWRRARQIHSAPVVEGN